MANRQKSVMEQQFEQKMAQIERCVTRSVHTKGSAHRSQLIPDSGIRFATNDMALVNCALVPKPRKETAVSNDHVSVTGQYTCQTLIPLHPDQTHRTENSATDNRQRCVCNVQRGKQEQ